MAIDYTKLPHKNLSISVRDFARNLSYYIDRSQIEPILITKRGKIQAVLTKPAMQKQTKKKKNLEDLAFFKDFVEPKEWKGRSSADIATELRQKATYGEW